MRGLILGGLAFAAVYAAERGFESFAKDISRYDELSAMSGSPTLFRKLLSTGMDMLTDFGSNRAGDAKNFVGSLQDDLLRYATLRGM